MSIAVIITDRNTDSLCKLLQRQLPEVNIQQWPDIAAPEDVRMAVLWNHPPGITASMPKLDMVVSMGAGMDHINVDSDISGSIKQERIVSQALKQNMAQYVLQYILNDHRYNQAYLRQQTQQLWQVLESDKDMPVVGFLGLGELGTFVADKCADLGFQTMAWTVRQKHPEHPCFHGNSGLKKVCQMSQYLVVLLPLNERTKGIINSKTLSWCSSDTVLINVGRGGHVNEKDLLRALDEDEIKQAVLDVFTEEPLPQNHPFWTHDKVTITPHSSSRSDINETAEQIVKYYQQL